jgi:iron complex outermembrane receptor protein
MAYTYGQDLTRTEPLPEIAPFDIRYILSGSYLGNKLKPEISFRYVSSQQRVSTLYGEQSSPSFSLLDLGLSYQFIGRISLAGRIQNVFDQAYYEHLSRSVRGSQSRPIYAPGRSFILTIAIDL